jgi:hypothetical protein
MYWCPVFRNTTSKCLIWQKTIRKFFTCLPESNALANIKLFLNINKNPIHILTFKKEITFKSGIPYNLQRYCLAL